MLTRKKSTLLLATLMALLLISGAAFFLHQVKTPKNGIKNVILVVFDTLRADRLGLYGFPKATTPFLNANRQSFLIFNRVRATAPWTVPSHASFFTGKLPAQHLADWGHMALSDEEETLAETLSQEGFCTSAFVANDLFKKDNPNLLQGFQSVYFPERKRRQERIMRKLASQLDKTAESKCRRFIFVNFMNNHLPYDPGKHSSEFGADGNPFLDESTTKWDVDAGVVDFPDAEKERLRRLYDASVRYSDELVERLISLLKKRKMLEDTLLIITSDHGDGLGYHPEVGHEISVWEEQLAVPLIVRFPAAAGGGREIADMTSLRNLHTMILKLTGSERAGVDDAVAAMTANPQSTIADYRSYFIEMRRGYNKKYAEKYPQLAEKVKHMHVLYCGDYKLLVRADGSVAFFDIVKDPAETSDVKTIHSEEFQSCRARYDALLSKEQFTPFDFVHPLKDDNAMDKEDVEALKSLGYL